MQKYSYYLGKFQLHSSDKEIKDLVIAWIFISIAFAIVRSSGDYLSNKFLILIAISAVTVGLGFLLHELAHKVVAQHYHCWAEFRADMTMLILALLMSFLGFVFIAPGAVMIFGNINKRQNGIISLAGPLTNIIIAILLLPLLFISTSSLWKEIISAGYLINAWLGLFNMIPLWNFDGIKIWRWSKLAYIVTLIIAAILIFIFFKFAF
ncbi:metalloprotease [Candidatus Woesearchaeota archaeon]|nr:metalloprotease [Candidatus Woesearchaeota archaeon]HIH54409.1 metalloprotease [Candidatus Woesearchaeota archaeon]HIJ01069.1 metalloprotease [Candidatus Woesearchaeota archaeon]